MKTILIVSYNELHITWGGVHRVNKLLIEGFTRQGYKCLYLINKSGQYFYINNKEIDENRIDRDGLKQYLTEKNVDIIINQEGIFSDSFHIAFRSLGLDKIKLLTVFHNTPAIYEKLYGYRWLLSQISEQKVLKMKLPYVLRLLTYPLWRKTSRSKTANRYRNIYNISDSCVMLSRNDIPTLKAYVPELSADKCVAIPNALTFDATSDKSILSNKQKSVLIVSRLNDDEKRISLALKIWRLLQDKKIDDWTLTIVGTGPHEDKLKKLSAELRLKNVTFEGRRQSEPYYEKAALFMMTSAVEGWGLTLTESMQRGVVPIAFDSYPALSNIVTNNHNGCIIPENDLDAYANRMLELMKNKEERERIACNALESCKRFEPEKVINKWIQLTESV